MLRGLIYHWRVNLPVLLGAAVTTAVLTGALLTGDSVRGSLRDLTLDRLGGIDRVLVGERYFRQAVAGAPPGLGSQSENAPRLVPAILLKGTATQASARARASGINILGIDDRFAKLYPVGPATTALAFPREAGGSGGAIVLNESLRREVGAQVGDPVILTFPRDADAPADTLLGRRDTEQVMATMRGIVTAIVPDQGPGLFDLSSDQRTPFDAYVPLHDLQRALARPERINLVMVADGELKEPDPIKALTDAFDLEDRGILLSRAAGHLSVEAREYVLRPEVVEGIESSARVLGGTVLRIQTYLATEIRSTTGSIPYSTVTAFNPGSWPLEGLSLDTGGPAPPLAPGEILLNTWAADDLHASAGSEVEMSYFVVGEREQLRVETAALKVRGIVAMTGLAADPTLTPDYPGIKGARDIAAWDPPFPVTLARIRPRDEEYWDRYGVTPKAFISQEEGERRWTNRYGSTTAVRVAPPAGADLQEFEARLRAEITRDMPLERFGLHVRRLKEEGLASAQGATDFGLLFIGFSFFLIVSSALLCGLLFSLGVERRAREIGVLLAMGYAVGRVRRRFLAEGGALAAGGVVLGLPAAAAYAGLMVLGLRTIWRPAAGPAPLSLHVGAGSLAIGGMISLMVVVMSIVWSVRRLSKLPVPALLGGRLNGPDRPKKGRLTAALALGGLVAGAGLLLYALVAKQGASPAVSFGIGAALLASATARVARWCRNPGRGTLSPGPGAFVSMALRNCAWNPGRSLLSVCLIGCACFVLVMVTASRRDPVAASGDRASATGGYSLVGQSDIPLHHDLNTPRGRADLGVPDTAEPLFAGVAITPFRVVPGDDVSCLNLFRPERPRLLGVPEDQIRRGGFSFAGAIERTDNPWSLLSREIGPGVVPAIGDESSVRWILHKDLAQDLVMQDEFGRPLALRFVALLEGSHFQGEILIAERDLLTYFPRRSGYSYFLIDAPEARSEEIGRVLEASLASEGLDVTTTHGLIERFHAVENTYLSTFRLLGGLGLLLGTLGLGVVAFKNTSERRPELAAMRAVGFPRRMLVRMVLAENAFLLAAGTLVGTLPALAAVMPRLVGGAGAPPWGAIVSLLAAVLVVGMVASLGAVLTALHAPLLPMLKEER
ncbi:MAG TPA: ABC transporter permease [Candidatus Polarisedimenticolia bacterium]|nr:ABC transporter permease [Candidatus Polarisedimenticolia bacterium]